MDAAKYFKAAPDQGNADVPAELSPRSNIDMDKLFELISVTSAPILHLRQNRWTLFDSDAITDSLQF
jgi:hypothetical protein